MTSNGLAINGEVSIWWDRSGSGQGEHLLLVNGLGSPSVAFEGGFVKLLVGAGYDVVRFDNRDVGRSSRITSAADPAYTLSDMAADAVAVLDAVGWGSAMVFGQSMGGMIAQQVAIEHPGRTDAVVSCMSATGEPGYTTRNDKVIQGLLAVPPTDREGWLAHRVETEVLWASPTAWDADWVRAKGDAIFTHGVGPAGSVRQYRAIIAAGSRDKELAELDVPALVIHGSADILVPPEAGRHTAEVIPGSSYVEIEGLGHDLPPAYWSRIVAEVCNDAWRRP